MNKQEIVQKLNELNFPPGKYAVFGSGPITVRNLRESHDLDIIVSNDLWDDYEKKWELKIGPRASQYLENNGIELWKNWGPGEWDIDELIKDAEIIDGFPFVKLGRVIEWKKINGREKDLEDIELIENFMEKN